LIRRRTHFLLKFLGYPKASVLHGGFQAWQAANIPVSRDAAAPAQAQFPIDPDAARIVVNAQTMLEAVKDPNIVKLDVRDVDEWIGTSSSPYGADFYSRKGRFPGGSDTRWFSGSLTAEERITEN
jgi:thiosulfate/3-mercaptopyruvate sulfurtransferase